MRYRQAKKLHNADEVTHKATRRVCRVVSTEISKKNILVNLLHPTNGFMSVNHIKVR